MRILLLGKNGRLGWELQRSLAPLGDLVALGREGAGPLAADWSHPGALAATVRAVAPDVIVNAAGHTSVDKAESEPDVARAINATAAQALAREAAACGAWLVHYSSDHVFDGSGSAAREEDAPTGPLNVYGQTKLEGEQAIRASGCRHLVVRTSWIYAARGRNFARTVLELGQEQEVLRVVADQVGAPTGADLIADLSAHMIRAAQADPSLSGTYHAVASGETSRHGYARHVLAFARAAGVPIRVNEDALQAVPTADFPTPALRPLNSRLATRRLHERFGLVLPDWRQGVDRLLTELLHR